MDDYSEKTRQIVNNEIKLEYIRASGPGGQNVNKVATSVQLKFDIHNSINLNDNEKTRLEKISGKKVTCDGVFVIEAKRYRTQEQNRIDAIRRLENLIQKTMITPTERINTQPTKSSKAARRTEKQKRGVLKKNRSYTPDDWD